GGSWGGGGAGRRRGGGAAGAGAAVEVTGASGARPVTQREARTTRASGRTTERMAPFIGVFDDSAKPDRRPSAAGRAILAAQLSSAGEDHASTGDGRGERNRAGDGAAAGARRARGRQDGEDRHHRPRGGKDEARSGRRGGSQARRRGAGDPRRHGDRRRAGPRGR